MTRLGRTGLQVHPIVLGTNVFGWSADEAASFAVLDEFVALGGNLIDTADVYSRWVPGNHGGESERVIGRWMAARGNRDQVLVMTKVGGAMGAGPENKGLHRAHVERGLAASLKRLGTDHVDVYFAHFDDPETPLEETAAAFREAIASGRVKHAAASNYTAERLGEALAAGIPYEVLQPAYSLLKRTEFEGPLADLCRAHDLGVVGYAALAGGFLSGKYAEGGPLPETVRAGQVQTRYMHERGWRTVAAVREVATEAGATPAQVALAWVLAHEPVLPIVSATTPDQLRELMAAADLTLDAEAIRKLDEASAGG